MQIHGGLGMVESTTSDKLIFESPGAGPWDQDPVHFPRPLTRYYQETQVSPFKKGTQENARFFGLLIDGLQSSYVNGFAYIQALPAPENEIPERFKRAEQVFAQKLWREQLQEWDKHCKPTSIAKHRELQSINPDTLSDEDLITYLKQCRDHHAAMIAQHMRFTVATLLPTGDFLAQVGEWTGLPSSELLGLMRGSSSISAGGSDEVEQLKLALAKDPEANEILNSDEDPQEVIQKLSSLEGNAGEAVRGYIELVGNRLIDGFDIAEPTAMEMPDALLRSMRVAVSHEQAVSKTDKQSADVRSKVPADHQSQFDELLQEARLTYRLRDERGVYSDIWAAGLVRRAVLSAGRRVASRGRIATPLQMLEASLDEMCDLILDHGGPSVEELDQRYQYRSSHTAKEAPPSLGSPKPAPPDLTTLPPSVARLMRAFMTSMNEVFGSSTAENEEKILIGLAASKGVYEGPACRVSGPSEFGRIKKGDVLVTESTSEAFNILLPLLGGLVTDNGGLLSHAAIVSREYGIPGVVGTREATERIRNGMRVRVDGDKGEVTVLE